MHIAIARYEHEPNRYAPIAVTLARATTTTISKGEHGAHDPVLAVAWPQGMVTQKAFDWACDQVIAEVGKGCQGLALDLHGAVMIEGIGDAERELLRRIRRAAPHAPISVTLDFHAEFSAAMVELGNIISGYPTYPRAYATQACQSAARLLMRIQKGRGEASRQGDELTAAPGVHSVAGTFSRSGAGDSPIPTRRGQN